MSPRLGIIVPYRDRADHLDEFLLRGHAFVDPVNAGISPRFLIVEQAAGLPFNRGALINVGFRVLAPKVSMSVCMTSIGCRLKPNLSLAGSADDDCRHGLSLPPKLSLRWRCAQAIALAGLASLGDAC